MTAVQHDGKVEFRFFRPGASRVDIAGDFNGWREEAMPMEREAEGWWVAVMKLPPGEYRFRYLADGRWFTDFAANGVEAGPMGWDGILVVPGEIAAALEEARKGETGRSAKDSRI